jgi:hypothetical protein
MTYPTPPGDNVPLYEGLDSSWNDIVGAFPEDKRAELAPLLQSRITEIEKQYEPLKQYEDFARSGITKDHAETALNIYSMIENNPKQIYDELGKYLGVSSAQAEKIVEQVQDADPDADPRIATMQQQLDTLMQIKLAEHNQTVQQKQQAEADAAIEKELNSLRKKHGDFDEEEVLMRMLHKGVTADQAFAEYTNKLSEIRRGRPAPMLLGGGGNVPRPGIDVKKLDSAGAKSLVVQMLQADAATRNA